MKDTIYAMRTTHWLVVLFLLTLIPACESGEEIAPTEEGLEAAPAGEMPGGMEGVQAADTTRLRTTYDEIGERYRQMMAGYEGMTDQMSPEARQLYGQMQQHYEQVMPEGAMGRGMMGRGMMGRHMMAMHDRGTWTRQMLDLHQQMMQMHTQEGFEEMARMHEQMTRLYRDALENMPAAEAEQAP